MSGTTTLFGSEDEELDNPGRRPPPYVLPVEMASLPLAAPSVISIYPDVPTLQNFGAILKEDMGELTDSVQDEAINTVVSVAERVKTNPRRTAQNLPMRTVPNPRAGDANQADTMQIYAPWRPHEQCMIRDKAPDRHKTPKEFVEYLRSTVEYYQATDRDIWSMTLSLLSAAERQKWKDVMTHQTWQTLKAVQAHADETVCVDFMMTTLFECLKKPINMSVVLDCKPGPKEDPQSYLDRFTSIYGTFAGDSVYNAGNRSPAFNAMLMSCLPLKVQSMIKTDLNWSDNDITQMRRAVAAFWADGAGNTAATSAPRIKTEYYMWDPAAEDSYQALAIRPGNGMCPGRGRGFPPRPQWDRPRWGEFQGGRNQNHPGQGRSRGERGAGGSCFRCGGRGHWKRECPSGVSGAIQGRQAPYSTNNPFSQ